MEIEKILTSNPYVDELVYYCKVLGRGCILKNESDALAAETLEASKASNLFIACTDKIILFEQLSITRSILERSSVDKDDIDRYVIDNSLIPENKRKEIINIASEDIINNYVELNNYYRTLNGTPKLTEKGIKITDWDSPPDIIIDLTKYVHEMNDSEIGVLDSYGIIDKLIADNPDKNYLNFLGSKKIDIYKARKSIAFQVLYLPVIDSSEIYDRFKSRLEINRRYCITAVYSEAFKYGSDYYDAFICVLIIVMTMIDVISSIQELIARKEVFDLRSIQYIFQSYGMPFYPEIPIKYQISMMKNINTLIKFKSTTKSMVDICSLFGFENIEIFKYYILRDRRKDSEGKFVFNFKEIPDPSDPEKTITVDNNEANYELKFIRVPLEGNADDYLRDMNNHMGYDDVTLSDSTWDGDLPHEIIKSQIIDKEFTYLRTKYISIDTVYEVTRLSFELPYFFNILFDDTRLEEKLVLYVPLLSNTTSFKLTDIFCYLFALTYEFNGIEDYIMDTTGKVLFVKGFNFKADLATLGKYVKEQGFTMEELGVSNFKIPKTSIMSYNQLLEIFTNNGKIRDHIIKQLLNADSKKIYDIYYRLYNALMITEFNNNYFRDNESGYMPSTYTEYLQRRDPTLYISLSQIHDITDAEVKVQKISSIVNNIIYALDEFIDSDTYRYIYSNFPSVSGEHIKQYVVKVINFFKSYKVDMLGINTIYKFDDKLDNTITIIDDLHLKYAFYKDEYIKVMDILRENSTLESSDKLEPLEKIYMDIRTWVNLKCEERPELREYIAGFFSTYLFKEIFTIDDIKGLELNYSFAKDEFIQMIDSIDNKTSLKYQEKFKPLEKIYLDIRRWIKNTYKEYPDIVEQLGNLYATFLIRDIYELSDDMKMYTFFEQYTKFLIEENYTSNINIVPKDLLGIKDSIMQIVKFSLKTKYNPLDTVEHVATITNGNMIDIIDRIKTMVNIVKKDEVNLKDNLLIVGRIIENHYRDRFETSDNYDMKTFLELPDDCTCVNETASVNTDMTEASIYKLIDSLSYMSCIAPKDEFDTFENYDMFTEITPCSDCNVSITEKPYINVERIPSDMNIITDKTILSSNLTEKDILILIDSLQGTIMTSTLANKVTLIDTLNKLLVTKTNRDDYNFFDLIFSSARLNLLSKVELEENIYINRV